MRRHLTYANVAATLALVFAMSGGALAAKHYLVESTTQISPKVLKKLRGHRGKTGAAGKTGATGLTGPAGAAGPAGKDGASATTLLAAINEKGEVVRAKGLVSSTKVASGEYTLTWDQPINSCYPVTGIFEFTGFVVIEGITEGTKLDIETYDQSGFQTDTGFYVAILC
jgi:hypothetical protein